MQRAPPSVWAALAAILVVVGVQIALAAFVARAAPVGWGMYVVAAVLGGVLLTGLVRRSRLAWLWGRYLSLFLAAVLAARLALAVARGEATLPGAGIMLLGFVLPLAVAGLALARPAACAWYRLVCPRCGKRTSLGADLAFTKARCRSCGEVW